MNILFTSVGRRTYLLEYFKDALGGKGLVHAANSDEMAPAFRVADKTVVTPLIHDDSYIPFLLEYCKFNNIDAIIPLFDIDLPVLSKNRASFEEIGTKVIVSDKKIIDICNDKLLSCEFLSENAVKTPRTFLNPEDVIDAVKSGKVYYPFIVKPRWGMGSIAVFEAENEQELIVFYKKAKAAMMKTYVKYEVGSNINESILIQEKLIGQEYGLDVINDLDGNYVTTIVKKKHAMRSGETDCAITVDDKSLKQLGRQLGEIMGHVGNLDVDVFKVNGENFVLEMNGRFGGGYPFSHASGVNLPLAIISWLENKPVEAGVLTEKFNVTTQKDIRLITF